jgi:Thioredoxin reductase
MIKTDALIIGAGPTGLFCAHQLGIIGLKCEIVDNLNKNWWTMYRTLSR